MATGPCPEIPEFGGTISPNFFTAQMAGRVPAPHGWTDAYVTYRRGSDASPRPMYIGFQFEDESFNYIRWTYQQSHSDISTGQTLDPEEFLDMTVEERAAVRYVSLWGYSGLDDPSAHYTWDCFGSITFTGLCDDLPAVASVPMVTILG